MDKKQNVAPVGSCSHPEVQLRVGSPDYEAFVAKSILEAAGDLRHGANHLANALTYQPGNKEWLALLDKYLATAQADPESLVPRSEELYFSTEAVRAYIWFHEGKYNEALDLLFDVIHAKPDSHYLSQWALPWLETPGVLHNISDLIGWRIFSLVLHTNPEARYSTIKGLQEMQRWAALNKEFDKLHPTKETRANTLRVGILRKAGLFEDSIEAAKHYMVTDKSWNMAASLALSLKAKGDLNAAIGAFKTSMTIEEGELVAKTEIADIYFDQHDFKTAVAWYEDILQSNPEHEWALPSALYCQFKLTKDEKFLDAMGELAKKDNQRAHELFFKEFGTLPPPADASAAMTAQMAEKVIKDRSSAPTGVVRVKTSSIEAPSNFLTFNMEMAALKHKLKLEVTSTEVPRPDPRFPVIPRVKYILWKYKDFTAEPALPKPAKEVSDYIAHITNGPYDENRNWAAASWVAHEVGAKRVSEILACMVHPPKMPDGWSALMWVPRVQLSAAYAVAQVDEGWDGSERKEALLSLLFGPCDWTTQAAIRAMAFLGRDQDVYAAKIGESFEKLSKYRPSFGFCCWEHTLYACWIRLPHLFPSEKEMLIGKIKEVEARLKA